MKLLAVILLALMILMPGVVSAEEQHITYDGVPITFDDDVFTEDEVRSALDLLGPPPMPPCAGNCDVWTNPFNEPVGDYSGGGQSIADMNADRPITYDWSGQEVWLYT